MNPDPNPVCSQRSDPDLVQIGPDPQHCLERMEHGRTSSFCHLYRLSHVPRACSFSNKDGRHGRTQPAKLPQKRMLEGRKAGMIIVLGSLPHISTQGKGRKREPGQIICIPHYNPRVSENKETAGKIVF